MSDEALYGSPADALRRLHTFVATIARATRVVVYLRRQDDHLSSRYQQVVKIGELRRFAERTEQMNFAATYDYHTRLNTWRRLVEPTSSSSVGSIVMRSWTVRSTRTSSTRPGSTYERASWSRSSLATRAWMQKRWSSSAS